MTNAIFWLRAIACLSVVAIHAISMSIVNYDKAGSGGLDITILRIIEMTILFGTPAFIFISEFLIAKTYKDGLPQKFIWNKIKYLIPPYVLMGFIYAFIEYKVEGASFFHTLFNNIFLGDFVCWFILIIIQFYLLHKLIDKYLKQMSAKWVVGGSFIVSALYLSFFQIIVKDPLDFIPFHEYIWRQGYWLMVFGWLYYFSLGYYMGRNYDYVMALLNKYKYIILILPVFSLLLILGLKSLEIVPHISSKRPDYLVHTTAIIWLVFYLTEKSKRVPRFIYFISNYSFSIYLLHSIFMYTLKPLSFMNMITYAISLFIIGIVVSIFLSFLINKFSIGKYLVGIVRTNGSKVSNLAGQRYSTDRQQL
ncbi:acyltransferase family protein [Paenibacillus cymbidii]|uniref:acyltransferase family protein n=1 Tax=Paenibacillus cymbidii TaxID=1639034 RepID=UPI001F15D919|nr:acyltransferase family protein [Paenibacillus cymbidii]